MFLTTIEGLPGMWREKYGASRMRIDVVAAAGRKADVKIDGLAVIEIGDRLGHGGGRRDERGGNHDAWQEKGLDPPNGRSAKNAEHRSLPRTAGGPGLVAAT